MNDKDVECEVCTGWNTAQNLYIEESGALIKQWISNGINVGGDMLKNKNGFQVNILYQI